MAKFYGKVGFAMTEETTPGIWTEEIVEKDYYGELTRNTRRYEQSGHLNDNLNISNTVSIIANPYALQNLQFIRYVEFLGAKWKVSDVEVQYPRLILSVGGVYNGETET